MPPIL